MNLIRIPLVIGVVVGMAAMSQATVMTFQDLNLGNYGIIPNTYGDNVTGPGSAPNGTYLLGNGWTPNVVTDYRTVDPSGTTYVSYVDLWNAGYGDLPNVAFAATNGYYAEITLTADAGLDVVLNSFDIASYTSVERPVAQLQILDGARNVLWNADGHTIPAGNVHSSFSPGIRGNVLILRWGDDWNTGVSNINFDQANPVPEPATLTILSLAAVAALRRRSR